MHATQRNNTSDESQTVSRTPLPYDTKKTNNDSQKLLRAVRRSMTRHVEPRNLKVVDALQLALNVLVEISPDGPSKNIDDTVDESTDSSDHSF
jgi:hypothetical protein